MKKGGVSKKHNVDVINGRPARRVRNAVRFILSVAVVFCVFFISTASIESDAASVTAKGVVTNNIHDNNYSGTATVSNSALVNNNDGTFSRVENMGDIVLVEKYNTSGTLLEQRFINMELPIYGGCFSGANYNYVLFGYPNPTNNSSEEVIRVVKYTKTWSRVGSASIYGCNTRMPFYGCNSDLTEYGNTVYVKAGHQTCSGGQASITFSFDSSTFKVTDILCVDSNVTAGCFANTAGTFIDASDGNIVTVDHSLTSPYSMVMSKYSTPAGKTGFTQYAYSTDVPLLGKAMATLGGLESSAQYYLAVGSMSTTDGTSPNQNVFVSAVPKSNFGKNTELAYLTGYAYGDENTVMTPYLVKVDGDHFVVIWETRKGYSETETIYYAYIDGAGNMRGEVKSMTGCLSDCYPILIGSNIYWYTTNGSKMVIYSLPAISNDKRTDSVAEAQVYNGVDYSRVYDYSFYVSHYADVRVLYQTDPKGALAHFVNSGMAEGRQGCENFNVFVYKANYADVRNAYGDDLKQYYLHFMNYGYAEGRKAQKKW